MIKTIRIDYKAKFKINLVNADGSVEDIKNFECPWMVYARVELDEV